MGPGDGRRPCRRTDHPPDDRGALSDHGILGEEYGAKESRSPFTWVLDPVDGTRAFVCGMPTWATLIGLSYEGKPAVGLMNQPSSATCSMAARKAPGEPRGTESHIATRKGIPLSRALVGTTAPELYRSEENQRRFQQLKSRAQLTRYGGDAYFFCMMAAGHMDIAMDCGLQPTTSPPSCPSSPVPAVSRRSGQAATS